MRGSPTRKTSGAQHPPIGAELSGESIGDPAFSSELLALLRKHRAVVVSDVPSDPDVQLALTASLGTVLAVNADRRGRLIPEMRIESSQNFDLHSERWHADTSWASRPARFTLLHALEIEGPVATTELLDTSLVVAGMTPAAQRELASFTVCHHVAAARRNNVPMDLASRMRRRMESAQRRSHDRRIARSLNGTAPLKRLSRPPEPGAAHPLVDLDPWTGRSFLRVGEHAWKLDHLDPAASRSLLDELEAGFGGPHLLHHWRTGDLLVFDNHLLLHRRGQQPDHAGRRVLRRTLAWHPTTPCSDPVLTGTGL